MRLPAVLIADDDAKVCAALRLRLQALGYQTVECRDGLGILAALHRQSFHAIILDHEMPAGDGRAVAKVIRQETDVPIVFLSGHPRDEFASIVFELPDVYYMAKPLDHEKLSDLLSSLASYEACATAAT